MNGVLWTLAVGMVGLGAGCGSDGSVGPEPGPDFTPPAAPRHLEVQKIRDGEIELAWEAVREPDILYIVYRSEGGAPAAPIDSTYAATYNDRPLEYQTEYTYHVTATDLAGNQSTPSNTVTGQPFNNLSPLAPTGVRAAAHNIYIIDQLEILIDWDPNAEADLEVYRIYRSTESGFVPGPENLLAESPDPRYVDQAIEVGLVYHYRIGAMDRGAKESDPSEVASDVALELPELLEPIQVALTSATPTFRWRPVPHAMNYRVVVTISPTSGEIASIPVTGDTAVVFAPDGQLQSGEIYYWKVIASTRASGAENSVSQVERFKVR